MIERLTSNEKVEGLNPLFRSINLLPTFMSGANLTVYQYEKDKKRRFFKNYCSFNK